MNLKQQRNKLKNAFFLNKNDKKQNTDFFFIVGTETEE